jgi:hypothetical protein
MTYPDPAKSPPAPPSQQAPPPSPRPLRASRQLERFGNNIELVMNSSRINAVNERGVSTGRRENLVVRDGEVKLFADCLRQEPDLIFGG